MKDNSLRAKVREAWNSDLKPTLKAMGRQGASEVSQALKAFPDSISPVETAGTVGNPTQMQISQDFGVHGKQQDADKAQAAGRAPENSAAKEVESDYEP